MGLFGDLFKTKEETFSNVNWIPLESEEQLNEILQNSVSKKQVIFKHSTRCGISRKVINQFEKQEIPENEIDLYYLDLLCFRDISNAIAVKFNVQHQSPQLIVLEDKKVIAHGSHHDILSIKF